MVPDDGEEKNVPPFLNALKINVDASTTNDNGGCKISAAARNETGHVVQARTKTLWRQ